MVKTIGELVCLSLNCKLITGRKVVLVCKCVILDIIQPHKQLSCIFIFFVDSNVVTQINNVTRIFASISVISSRMHFYISLSIYVSGYKPIKPAMNDITCANMIRHIALRYSALIDIPLPSARIYRVYLRQLEHFKWYLVLPSGKTAR